MATIFSGYESGLLNTSLTLLNTGNTTNVQSAGHGEQIFVNAANGNLVLQQRDAYLPSQGDDYLLVRTYNSRGRVMGSDEASGWTMSTGIKLREMSDANGTYYEVDYGDGSVFDYRLDAATGNYVSTDGAGAFETLELINGVNPDDVFYTVTRANQSQLNFDQSGRLISWIDTNNVSMQYLYNGNELSQVIDDQGHTITYIYKSGNLSRIEDENQTVLVQYEYDDDDNLTDVIDREGHRTTYTYNSDGLLSSVTLPDTQDDVDGNSESYATRTVRFDYDTIAWRDSDGPDGQILRQMTDAQGGITTFDYSFDFMPMDTMNPGREYQYSQMDYANKTVLSSGTTLVVDALGNNRAYSNDSEYRDWRVANGFYQYYDSDDAADDPNYQLQVDQIKRLHSLTYAYREDGYITSVTDQQGFVTQYTYDADDNLISIIDKNGWGALNSDSNEYRALRARLGVMDIMGNGKIVAELSAGDISLITAAYTAQLVYDDRGNLLQTIDQEGNVTNFTYTNENQLASTTTAVGNALIIRNDQLYQDKRIELGYAAMVENLSAADKQAILALHTTTLSYDTNQNLIERRSGDGELTRYEYDSSGNLVRQIVFLDQTDLIDTNKQQVTQLIYDVFGNNIEIVDAEGNRIFNEYDQYGNLISVTDGNGGVTRFTYDGDNRVITITDPEGHSTVNAYDAVGNRIAVTDANGHTVTQLYDLNNNLLAVIDPEESSSSSSSDSYSTVRTTTFEYDVLGNQTSSTDANGNTTDFVYNARRELVELISAEVNDENGNLIRYTSTIVYDGEGNILRSTDNRGFASEIAYARNNLVYEQTDANGQVTRFSYDANNNQVQIIVGMQLAEIRRQVVSLNFDEENQLIAMTDALGNSSGINYDAVGNQIAITDANGNTTNFEYDKNNRVIKTTSAEFTDPDTGLASRYVSEQRYDANGNAIETIDANGNSTRYTFDNDNRAVMVEDGNGIKTVFEYDSRNNRTSIQLGVDAAVDLNGNVVVSAIDQAQVTRFVYDEFNQLIEQVDGMGNALAENDGLFYQDRRDGLGYERLVADLDSSDKNELRDLYTTRFEYDNLSNLQRVTDPLGRTTGSNFDALSRLTSVTDADNNTTTFRYDANSNQVSQTDALGRVSSQSYDSLDRLTDSTNAVGMVTRTNYDEFSNVISQTVGSGTSLARTAIFEYDLNNRVIQQLDPEGHAQQIEYDAVGNRVRVIDANGNPTQYVYDALNRSIKIIDALNFETQIEYDGVGNQISLIDANGGIARIDYDASNRVIKTTDAEGRVSTMAYDRKNNRIEARTAVGTTEEQATTFAYNAQNKLYKVTDALGNETRTEFDRVYNQTAVTDANGNTTRYEFDALNRVTRVTNADGGVSSISYDALSNQLTQTNELGQVTSFTYDDLNRQITQTDNADIQTQFSYDIVGNQSNITRAANTAQAATDTFVYDQDNRLIAQTDAEGNTTQFFYDASHNQTQVMDANGNVTLYTYDANNRVASIQDAEGNLTRYNYDGNGNRTQVIDPRGYVATVYYNANDEVSLSVNAEGFAMSYQYDANGNVTSQTLYMQRLSLPLDPNTLPTVTNSNADQTTQFEFDALNRVSARTDGEGYRTLYVYDAVGNRLETQQALDTANTQFAVTRSYYDDLYREVAVLSSAGFLLENEYDVIGNVSKRTIYDEVVSVPTGNNAPEPNVYDDGRSQNYDYDSLNRLTGQTSYAGTRTEFEYDALGNQTAIIEAISTSSERRTEFSYDKVNRLTDTLNPIGTITRNVFDANGNVIESYNAYGTLDERVTYLEYDGNNRVSLSTDALGNQTQSTYDASGNLIAITGAPGLSNESTLRYEYDGNNRQTAVVNGEGDRSESIYDGAGNQTSLTLAPGLAEQRTNLFEYDKDNRLQATIDGNGGRIEYIYDGQGNKIETIQAVGIAGEERRTYYVYDSDSRLLQVTDPMGYVTSYEYDLLGNQTRITNPKGEIQTNTFDILGQLVSSLSPAGILTTNVYDIRGNIVQTTQSYADGSDARTTNYAFDILDRQVLVTDPENFSTQIEYDIFGNQTRVTTGLYLEPQSTEHWHGDGDSSDDYLHLHANPNYDPIKASRAFGQSNIFSYDANNQMLSMTDGLGNISTYGYDEFGNRTSFTQASNSVPSTTLYNYDRANRLAQTLNPDGGYTRKTYDGAGNLVMESILQSVVANGDEVVIERRFEYEGNGRVSAEIDPYGARIEYTFDALGNEMVTKTGAGASDERVFTKEYDLNNRLVASIDGEGYRTQYVFDSVGNRIKVISPLGQTARYYFDSAGNMLSMLDPDGYITEFSYDSAGNRLQETVYMTAFTGAVDDYVAPAATISADDRISSSNYDKTNRVLVRIEADGERTEYSYDAVGNLLHEVQYAQLSNSRELFYIYDLNNRLTTFTDYEGSVTTFSYDGANNKTRESISYAQNPSAVRTTVFQYDLNNRIITEIFDPAGLNYIQSKSYDRAGNIVTSTSAKGATDSIGYNLNNQLSSQTDAVGNITRFEYDSVGNQTNIIDGNGNITTLVYDGNSRVVQELQALRTVFNIDGGTQSSRASITHVFDGVGNEVQTIDGNGFTSTRYFDSSGRVLAEINGDNVLTTFTYNAIGEQFSSTLYMDRVAASAQDQNIFPTLPTGEARTITQEFDRSGRVTRRIYPPVEITTLSSTDTNSPVESRLIQQLDEVFVYDDFGNVIEQVDIFGNRLFFYFDNQDRVIAQTDAEGYLVELDYDEIDNVVEQRNYEERIDISTLSSTVLPIAPLGGIQQVNRVYNLAGQMIEERSPAIEVYDPATGVTNLERILTRFTYDGVGNETSKTIAAGTTQEITEYSYYDGANQRIAVIDANRVLNIFGFDGAGNQAYARRYYNVISTGVDLSSLTGETNFAALIAVDVQDQTLVRSFNGLSLLETETDLMGPGSDDDISRTYYYDGAGNRSWSRDADGYTTQVAFNALGNVSKTITSDGVEQNSVYDAAGNLTYAYTGGTGSSIPTSASQIEAVLGQTLRIKWNLPANESLQSYVVYDTVSRTDLTDYLNKTAVQGTWLSQNGAVDIPVEGFGIGNTTYFRIVTEDAAGNLTWTSERSIQLPPRYQELKTNQISSDTVEITARFDAGSAARSVNYGLAGGTTAVANFVDQGNGLYKATISNVSNLQDMVYSVRWQDTLGMNYNSSDIAFSASSNQNGIQSTVIETSVINGSVTQYKINLSTRLSDSEASSLRAVVAEWRPVNGTTGLGGTSVVGVDSGLGYYTYDLILADNKPIDAGEYEIILRGISDNGDKILDIFTVTLGAGILNETVTGISWDASDVGDSQIVIIGGQRVTTTRYSDQGRIVANSGELTSGSYTYQAYYGNDSSVSHNLSVNSTSVTTGFDVNVTATLDASESSNVSGAMRMAWRVAGSGASFSNDVALTQTGDSFTTTLPSLAAGQYDIKIYYTNAQGQEVIVDWKRIDTADSNITSTSQSVTVLADEDFGSLSIDGDGLVNLKAGLYSGDIIGAELTDNFNLQLGSTGLQGASLNVDGRDRGYYTENVYNAMGSLIATNQATGNWREMGVDANGNAMVTYTYGDKGGIDPRVSYSTFDMRKRETASFSTPVSLAGAAIPERQIVRKEYNVNDKVISETNVLGGITTRNYDAIGNLLSETNPLGNSKTMKYDRFGRVLQESDALGYTKTKSYDLTGRMISETDAEGNQMSYTYDAFNRRVSVANALSQTINMAYDQRDRLVQVTDALNGITQYEYDGRDNRSAAIDANGNRTAQVWDGLNRVIDTISYQNGEEIHVQTQYDAYGNVAAEIDGEGRVKTSLYGAFSVVLEKIDEGGRRTYFEYDRFGNLLRETSPDSGKDITRSYDELGRLLSVNDIATGVSTTYTYDITGSRLTEVMTTGTAAHDRNISYSYDALGQMTRWIDSVTGMNMNYLWDANGNLYRASTDVGYDPDNKGAGDPAYQFIDHVYSFDKNNRVRQITTTAGGILNQYTYDAAGNRIASNDNGAISEYQYDANGRVIEATTNGNKALTWEYDAVGNILEMRAYKDNGDLDQENSKSLRYYENNRNYYTAQNDQQTLLRYDKSGRIIETQLGIGANRVGSVPNDVLVGITGANTTYFYDHSYYADGRDKKVTAYGNANGSTSFTYNENDKKITINKGQGDSKERPEYSNFVYNNDDQIIYRLYDNGNKDETASTTEYAFANSKAVGETGVDEKGVQKTELDSGSYSLLQPISKDNPVSAFTFFTARAGDTLQSIASAVYGNPSLWYVIAEANGLNGDDVIREGQQIRVPNNVKDGKITSQTHKIYNEEEIIGSTLPNLTAPPPSTKKGCGGIIGTIIAIVITVIAAIFVPILAGQVAAFLGLGTGALATVASFVVAGALVGAAASIVQQGLFIAIGLQDKFSWREVAAGFVQGALQGAAQGIGVAKVAGMIKAGTTFYKYAEVAARALKVAAVASKQYITNGKITSWTSLATTALSSVDDFSGSAVIKGPTLLKYVSPWVQLAETYYRNDGELSPTDWASAVGQTLTTALTPAGSVGDKIFSPKLSIGARRFIVNAFVGGALSQFDKQAGINFITQSAGREIGQLIGDTIVKGTSVQRNKGTSLQQRSARATEKFETDYRTENYSVPPEVQAWYDQRAAEGKAQQRVVSDAELNAWLGDAANLPEVDPNWTHEPTNNQSTNNPQQNGTVSGLNYLFPNGTYVPPGEDINFLQETEIKPNIFRSPFVDKDNEPRTYNGYTDIKATKILSTKKFLKLFEYLNNVSKQAPEDRKNFEFLVPGGDTSSQYNDWKYLFNLVGVKPPTRVDAYNPIYVVKYEDALKTAKLIMSVSSDGEVPAYILLVTSNDPSKIEKSIRNESFRGDWISPDHKQKLITNLSPEGRQIYNITSVIEPLALRAYKQEYGETNYNLKIKKSRFFDNFRSSTLKSLAVKNIVATKKSASDYALKLFNLNPLNKARAIGASYVAEILMDTGANVVALGRKIGGYVDFSNAPEIIAEMSSARTLGQVFDAVTLIPVASVLKIGKMGVNAVKGTRVLHTARHGQSTGVAKFDQLFIESPQAQKMILAFERRGVTVVDDVSRLDSGASAQVLVRKDGQMTLLFDSKTTNFLDILHEGRHIAQGQRLLKSGVLGEKTLWGSLRMRGAGERGAYEFEQRLGSKFGFSKKYLDYTQKQIDFYYPKSFSKKFINSPTMNNIFKIMEPGLKP